MAATDPHFRLRLPEELKAKIEASAQKGRRSITAEVIRRLEWTFESNYYEVMGPEEENLKVKKEVNDSLAVNMLLSLELEEASLESILSAEFGGDEFSSIVRQSLIYDKTRRIEVLKRKLTEKGVDIPLYQEEQGSDPTVGKPNRRKRRIDI